MFPSVLSVDQFSSAIIGAPPKVARHGGTNTIPAMIDWDRVYHQVVNDNWTLLAAFAWKNFSELGRGAVMVQGEISGLTEDVIRQHLVV